MMPTDVSFALPPDGPSPRTPLLELRGITKAYPSVLANDGIDLRLASGEIHAVLGENGAGKSTLMKIIYGVVQPDAGEILWQGAPVVIGSPARARALGIGMVFQQFSLFETLTVAENIALVLPGGRSARDLADEIEAVSQRYGLPVDPRRLVHALSVGERQRVEIVRCLLQAPRLLILDEPTSVLAPRAIDALFAMLRTLAAEGCSILIISHKLEEIRSLCERATVLRNGRVTGHCDPRRESAHALARLMIGRDLPAAATARPSTQGDPALEIDQLRCASSDPFGVALHDLSLSVRAGEIVGIAGVSGNGQREWLALLSGELRSPRGQLRICGVDAGAAGPAGRRALGMAFVPEERLGRATVPGMSLAENALLTAHRQGLVGWGLVRRGAVRAFASRCLAEFGVQARSVEAEAGSLSGGNLQRFIVGRELLQRPRLLIVSQPTWGVDVGAAAFIRQALVDLRTGGAAILMFSEDLEELFECCDRIAVLYAGRLSPVRARGETSLAEIGRWMGGDWEATGAVPRRGVAERDLGGVA